MEMASSNDAPMSRFGVLGPLEVWGEGGPVSLGGPQQVATLSLLLLHRNTAVSIERALDAIWGEDPPAQAVATLRIYVSRIRKLLGDQLGSLPVSLETTSGGYKLVVDPGLVDADQFEKLVYEGRRAAKERAAAEARTQLSAALRLPRGRAYPELEDDDHARSEGARLAELELIAIEELTDVRLTLGEHDDLVAELRGLVAHHPLRERLWGHLMLAEYRSGQQSAALRTYRRAAEILVEELGVDPTPELQQLEDWILVQDERLDLWRSRPTLLPTYATSFVGRQDDMDRLGELLATGRLLTITGTAGVGKTRLAAELGRRLSEEAQVRVWWVDLSTAATPGDVYAAAFRGLSIRQVPGVDDEQLVAARVRDEQGVLIVDDCGSITNAVSLVSIVLEHGANVRVITTSQRPLHLGAEVVYRLEPLEVPPVDIEAIDAAYEYDALRLLIARTPMGTGRHAWNAEEAASASELVRRLDGIPLAIELAAGVLPTLSIDDLVSELDRHVDILSGGDPGGTARHRTLRTAVGWSIGRLSPTMLDALRRATVFAYSFDLEAADAVFAPGPDSPAATLTELVNRSLVSVDTAPSHTRFRLLATVAMVVGADRPETLMNDATSRHREHFRQRAEQVWVEMVGPDLGMWLERTRLDHTDYLAVIRSSLTDDPETALLIASAISLFWFRIGYLRESRVLLSDALDAAGPNSRWRARGLAGLARLVMAEGSADRHQIVDEAEFSSRTAEDPIVRAHVLDCLVRSKIERGEIEEAARTAQHLFEFASLIPSPEGLAVAHHDLGTVLFSKGDFDSAWEHLVIAREKYRDFRRDLDAGWVLVALADVALARGAVDDAQLLADAAIADFRARADHRGVSASLTLSGRSWLALGEEARALAVLNEAVELAQRWSYRAEAEQAEQALATARSASR